MLEKLKKKQKDDRLAESSRSNKCETTIRTKKV